MRVVEPSNFTKKNSSPKSSGFKKLFLLIFACSSIFLVGLAYILNAGSTSPPSVVTTDIKQPTVAAENEIDSSIKSIDDFSGDEFRLFYDNLLQPNTQLIEVPPLITGHEIADTRIQQLASKRGYLLRSSSSVQLTAVNGHAIQQEVLEPLQKLLAAVSSVSGSQMVVVSAHREVQEQKELFLERLGQESVIVQDIADGKVDEEITKVLVEAAPPGYSKHHSGYTVDFSCSGFAFRNFKNSTCHDALVANNYRLARNYGFIPSYPADADLQGPDPEAWEYVWVGDVIM